MARKKLSEMTPFERVGQRMKGLTWEEAESIAVEILARCLSLHLYVRKDAEQWWEQFEKNLSNRTYEWKNENALDLAMAAVGLELTNCESEQQKEE